ncbi:hypothetical protein JJQ72_06755 [Paenibacillus sp. F411]|uniref:WXG100 family type VII secretion target n=1 Tax=Paenibacillus algicola TaxID=2565926 RepID=A0A4P8XLS9_9BACL|nr:MULTISPECIES: hypothetical protein [Paenibacillus]MBO2943675.1 hypothetical protein [Paenibacillus sp. F411]QCT03716.1 hypothetical protein E6C60_3005 [Paenibacillus algicola]
MNHEIRLELNELLQAERELSALIGRLHRDEQEARVLYNSLSDWKGQSANVLRDQIEVFFSELARRIQDIERQKLELVRYVQHMRQVDGAS